MDEFRRNSELPRLVRIFKTAILTIKATIGICDVSSSRSSISGSLRRGLSKINAVRPKALANARVFRVFADKKSRCVTDRYKPPKNIDQTRRPLSKLEEPDVHVFLEGKRRG